MHIYVITTKYIFIVMLILFKLINSLGKNEQIFSIMVAALHCCSPDKHTCISGRRKICDEQMFSSLTLDEEGYDR